MTDVVDKATRSRMMSGIRSKNTKPEMLIRKALHARGFRFRLHVKDLPGKPDLVFPKYKAVIFVHGCFWHGHDCRYFKIPKTRTAFWLDKIESNRQRDRRDIAALNALGWRVFLIWECSIRADKKSGDSSVNKAVSFWLLTGTNNLQVDVNGIGELPCSTTESATTSKESQPSI